MSTNTFETLVLNMFNEDTTTPMNFDGTSIVRESIGDAIDELCLFGGFSKKTFNIPLRESQNVYVCELQGYEMVYPNGVWLYDTGDRLEQSDFASLSRKDGRFLQSRGTPTHYIPVGTNKLFLYPAVAGDDKLVEVEAVAIPDHYGAVTDVIEVQKEFRLALVHYCLYELYLLFSQEDRAISHFQQYMRLSGLERELELTVDREWKLKGEEK